MSLLRPCELLQLILPIGGLFLLACSVVKLDQELNGLPEPRFAFEWNLVLLEPHFLVAGNQQWFGTFVFFLRQQKAPQQTSGFQDRPIISSPFFASRQTIASQFFCVDEFASIANDFGQVVNGYAHLRMLVSQYFCIYFQRLAL